MRKLFIFILCLLIAASCACANKKKADKMLLIEVFSSTCEACVENKPVVDEIEKEFSNDLDVVRYDLNTPDGFEKAKPYQTAQIPVFIFFDRNGRQFFKHSGKIDRELLTGILKSKM